MQLSEKAQASLNKVIARFERGDLSPVVEMIRIRRHPEDTMPAAAWSLANQVIAYIQAGELDCRGFRQWEQAQRKVIKGARAVYILGPCTRKIEDETADDGHRLIVTGFRTIPVFPLSMTEGEPLPHFDYTPADLPPLYPVAKRLGVSVDYGPIEENANGWYSPNRKHIRLGTHHPRTFYHELAHAAHDKIEGVKGGQDAEQETIAEFTAAVLGELYGTPTTGNAWRYIQHYADDPLTAIYKALSTVEKVLALILAEEPEAQQEPVFA